MMSLTPQDPGPIDQKCGSHDAWCLLSWRECVSEDGVFVERRLRWWMREMITLLTLPLPSRISTIIHFPFVFLYSYSRVQQSHIHNSHSNPLGTPQRRRKCMMTHWRGHFTYYISPSKVLLGYSHRLKGVVMVGTTAAALDISIDPKGQWRHHHPTLLYSLHMLHTGNMYSTDGVSRWYPWSSSEWSSLHRITLRIVSTTRVLHLETNLYFDPIEKCAMSQHHSSRFDQNWIPYRI